MAIKIYEKFAPRANPADGDYPYGSIKNESVPGAKDGTPLDAEWGNDYAGFDAALLDEAGIVPSGDPDTVGNSQRVEAIKKLKKSSDKLTFQLNLLTSLLRNQDDINREVISVKNWVGVTDGVTDNTAGFIAGINHCYITGRKLYLPNPDTSYLITSTVVLDQFIAIEGEAAGLQDQYNGLDPAGTLIKYTGTGPCFHLVPSAPSLVKRRAYGTSFAKLVIKGTSSASHGIKISDKANIGNDDLILSGITIDDVFCYDFKHGRGLDINWCFGNNIKNYEAQTCGVALTLNYAHRTTITAGTLEQCLVGLDAINTYDVTFNGTGLQGCDSSRIASQGLQVPADFFVWDGWDGTGTDGISRSVPADYAGVGVRNLGSSISWFGGYEESNEVGYVCELGSETRLYGKYSDLDAKVKYYTQFGAGSFSSHNHKLTQGNFPALVSVFHTERPGALAPISIIEPTFDTVLPEIKKYTGPQTAAGFVDNFIPTTYRGTRKSYDYDLEVIRGSQSAEGFKQTGGFNKYLQETISPTSSGTLTKDLGAGTVGTSFLHVVDSANIEFSFSSGGDRLGVGVECLLHVINIGASAATITFSGTYFRVGAASYTLPSNKQRIFKFIFSNGFFIEQGVEVSL